MRNLQFLDGRRRVGLELGNLIGDAEATENFDGGGAVEGDI